jgi:PTS system nitrogen regulatory IIA component
MKIVDIITPERVIHELTADNKSDLLRELAAHLVQCDPNLSEADAPRVVEVLLERERLASTGISDGVAIPHGKLMGLPGISSVIGIKHDGLDFGAIDNQLSRIFVVLLAPENSAGMHLKALARISQLLKDPQFRDQVLEAPDAGEVYRVIAEEDAAR